MNSYSGKLFIIFLFSLSDFFLMLSYSQNINTSENFPDPYFRASVENFMGVLPGGTFTAEQAAAKTGKLDCSFRGISDMKGIEFFTSITELYCGANDFYFLDLSQNHALMVLDCPYGSLRYLNIINNYNLRSVNCYYVVYLQELYVPKNVESIDVCFTSMKVLDFSQNTELRSFHFTFAMINNLDLSNKVHLTSISTEVSGINHLNVSNCSNLTSLLFLDTGIQNINISNTPKLKSIYCLRGGPISLDTSTSPALESLILIETGISNLNLINNPLLNTLICSFSQLNDLNQFLPLFFNPNLVYMDVSYNLLDCDDWNTVLLFKSKLGDNFIYSPQYIYDPFDCSDFYIHPPSNLHAVSVFDDTVVLYWSDNSDNESGFLIERSETGENGPWEIIGSVDAEITGYEDTGLLLAIKTYSYRVKAFNNEGSSGYSNIAKIINQNTAPIITSINGTSVLEEGTSLALTAQFSDSGILDTHTAVVDWGDGNSTPISVNQTNKTVAAEHVFVDDGIYIVILTVTDTQGEMGIGTFVVTVKNADPVVTVTTDPSITEGELLELSVAGVTDAGSKDHHTATIDWGDGSLLEDGIIVEHSVFGSHVYADNGAYQAKVSVTDDDGGTGVGFFTVFVNNMPPVVDAGADRIIAEGFSISLDSVTFNDPGTLDTHIAQIFWGDSLLSEDGIVSENPFGPPGDVEGLDGTVNGEHIYYDSGEYSVSVTIKDDENAEGSDSLTVSVDNVAPVCGNISGLPDVPILINTPIQGMIQFTDPGVKDTHSAVWNWGNGDETEGTVSKFNETGSVLGDYTFSVPRIYRVTLNVTDDDGGECSSIYDYVIVIDPNAGFITGGGWIQNETSGKDEFGFSAKYVKNQEKPVGGVEFKFGESSFKSTGIDWLVVYQNQAKFAGSGMINAEGDYGFMLTAIDGDLVDKDTPDEISMKIWQKEPFVVIYDNLSVEPDHSFVAVEIGNGSIVIHQKGNEGEDKEKEDPGKDEPKDKGKKEK
jgi:hypothetical protein